MKHLGRKAVVIIIAFLLSPPWETPYEFIMILLLGIPIMFPEPVKSRKRDKHDLPFDGESPVPGLPYYGWLDHVKQSWKR